MKRIFIFLLVYLSAVFINKIDAQNINFSGKWTLNEEKTNIPGFPIVTLEIEQTADQLIYKGLVPQSSGDTIVTIKTMRLDGSEGKYTDHRGDEYKCSAFIQDGMLITKYQSKQKRSGEYVVIDIQEEHSLLDKGKTLSVIHMEGMDGQMGRYPNPLVFDLVSGLKKKTENLMSEQKTPKLQIDFVSDEFGDISTEVDSLMKLIIQQGAPSVSAAITINGKLIWAKNYNGVAGLQTIYGIGSITKTFTATAILQLYEKGLIDLDKDVSEYLPFKVRHPEYPEIPITVKMLLSHQSGLTKDNLTYFKFSEFSDSDLIKWSEQLEFTLPHFDNYPLKKDFFRELLTPGGIYYTNDVWIAEPNKLNYSNIGYGLLTLVVEHIVGISFEEYVTKNIFQPLEMMNTGFDKNDLMPNIAPPCEYVTGNNFLFMGTQVPNPPKMNDAVKNNLLVFPVHNLPSGPVGVKTTVEDLAKFQSAHMNNGTAINGYQLLKKETIEMMHQIWAESRGAINQYPLKGQGFGWAVCQDRISGHIGGQLGYTAMMIQKQTDKGTVGYIVLLNFTHRLNTDIKGARSFWENYEFPFEDKMLQYGIDYMNKN